ncbi:hypothetical protein SIN8267_01117 [Sinobacterium norvegicum]|uniref:Sulfotransferase family protein n=1 Tax=Sinobacterium norvegicum TaxID=1641715 RepID=A0ABM9ACU5_9GAMM|nr:sulfotransferase [Sinobacterium norvegicum]CAH0991016.1 hypothetical protein SIN8267_01117 [Sinobacterium norvegicum]
MNKLFVIGLPRTGTTSISVALLDYDFSVAHTAFTKRAFELADVVSDAPCFSDYRQLDGLFPGSRFVYLRRDITLWLPSIRRLLKKMADNIQPKTGSFNPVLKRSFYQTFGSLDDADAFSDAHLSQCYSDHQAQVLAYFDGRDDLLQLDISDANSLPTLLDFIGIEHQTGKSLPHVNRGNVVDHWKETKHPNKVNPLSAGVDHRQFFDY